MSGSPAAVGKKAGAAPPPKGRASDAVMGTYARQDIVFVRGEGAWLTDASGARYLDFGSGVAVNSLGHAHPRLVAALKEQAEKLWHTSNLYRVEGQERVAERLTEITFAERVFFCNSGAEACEGAIKLARRYHFVSGKPERNRIITFKGAFHGRTLATLAAAGNPRNLASFGPVTPGFDHVPYGDLASARAAMGPETAAILVEPIQGDGGIRVPPPGFLAGLRALATASGALLMFDEIQTGIGRTGTLFAHQSAGVSPDVMTLAKGLGGGFPVGACVATHHAAAAMTAGSHASTFGGNPLAMSVAQAVLDVVADPDFLARVVAAGARLASGLDRLVAAHRELFTARRGQGLMLGLQCTIAPAVMTERLRESGLLVAPAQDQVIRLLPPLIVSNDEIDEALAILDAVASVSSLLDSSLGMHTRLHSKLT